MCLKQNYVFLFILSQQITFKYNTFLIKYDIYNYKIQLNKFLGMKVKIGKDSKIFKQKLSANSRRVFRYCTSVN